MMMNRTKGYALMFLLGAFITGGALGFTADRVIGGGHAREGRASRAYRQRMAEELNLTPVQQASVDSLIEQKHRQIVALYQPMQPQLDSLSLQARVISDSTHEQIKRLLKPEQQVKLDNMRAAARKDLAERRARDSASGKLRNSPPKF
jgi:Spy/CpxP family protein refolding chaperone